MMAPLQMSIKEIAMTAYYCMEWGFHKDMAMDPILLMFRKVLKIWFSTSTRVIEALIHVGMSLLVAWFSQILFLLFLLLYCYFSVSLFCKPPGATGSWTAYKFTN